MQTFLEYIQNLNESRYKTHGVQHVKKILPKLLNTLNLKFNLDINKLSDDFQLYFYNNGNFDEEIFDVVISKCEIIGYFPAYMTIDERDIFKEFKEYVEQKHKKENNKRYFDFIDFLKTIKFDNFKEIYIQFESWQDSDIDYVPEMLYHVCRQIDLEKIKKNGLSPKSKNKISFHPDRIYLTTNLKEAEQVIKEFKKINNENLVILKIEPDQELMNILKLKKDPDWADGYYTTQNISRSMIDII